MDEVATVQARLWKALRESELVRVELGIKGSDAREGYVVAIGRKWLLLRVFDHSIFLDGYSAVRRADVTGVQRGKNGEFVRRALVLQGAWRHRHRPVRCRSKQLGFLSRRPDGSCR